MIWCLDGYEKLPLSEILNMFWEIKQEQSFGRWGRFIDWPMTDEMLVSQCTVGSSLWLSVSLTYIADQGSGSLQCSKWPISYEYPEQSEG